MGVCMCQHDRWKEGIPSKDTLSCWPSETHTGCCIVCVSGAAFSITPRIMQSINIAMKIGNGDTYTYLEKLLKYC